MAGTTYFVALPFDVADGSVGSCPYAWCSFLMVTTIAGHGRACQVATAGNPTMGLSLMGAMVSSVM